MEVFRHHRLLEAFLVDRLGFSGDTVHAEACRLEHVISEEFEARIDEQLGHPLIDPHGAPIPSSKLVMPIMRRTTLSSLRPGETAVVCQVVSTQADRRLELEELDLFPGVRLAVIARDPASGSLTLSTARRPSFQLSAAACEQLQVEQDA
jgi:DtxR family Mn-dependent transcriptional regulator